jgi:5-methylthioadenosine/S-adenosylhomocysteine deaminase
MRIVPHGEYVIEAGWVLAYQADELTLLRDASILVRNDRIEEVREGQIPGSLTRINIPEQLVVPGFINGHTHACSGTPTRGIIEGGRSYARPLELVEQLSDNELDDLTAYNVYELLRGGCTTHVEMSLSLRQAESYVRVAKKWGVRGYPGGMIPGIARLFPVWLRKDDQTLFDSVSDTLKEIEANLAFGRANNGAAEGRILPMMAPHATDTHTPETFAAILAGAKELGNGIHIHLAQSRRETAVIQKLWGATPVQWLEQLGLLDVPLFGAHMSGIDWDKDPEILNRHGTVYVHCPSGSGAGGQTQPYPEALGAEMNVNIGTDTHSNDYLENLKLAVVYGRERYRLLKEHLKQPLRNPTIWPAIEGATLVAAKGLGREDIGRITPGAKADLTTIDVSGPLVGAGALPPEPLNNLLYASGLSVRNVITDGMFQVFDGELVVDNPIQVAQAGGQVVQKIWNQLSAEDWFTPTDR